MCLIVVAIFWIHVGELCKQFCYDIHDFFLHSVYTVSKNLDWEIGDNAVKW